MDLDGRVVHVDQRVLIATMRVELPDGSLGGAVQIEVLAGGPDAGRLEVTGGEGAFKASYAGRFPRTDEIRATLVTEAYGSFESEVRTQPWNTPVVVLDQGSDQSMVGESHTVTARVTGTQIGEVSFRVEEANAGATVEGSGDLPTVTGTYTGRAPGVDRITAEITVAERRYASTSLDHTWISPELVLSQDTEVPKTGEPVLLTATVAPSGIQGRWSSRSTGTVVR